MSIQVRLTGNNPALHDRCAEALMGDEFRIVSSAEVESADVVVLLAPATAGEAWPVATISVAPNAAGDAILPADFTARELQLACQLAARITAAQRALEQAQQTEGHLRQAVDTDPLTGLANRRAWEAARLRFAEHSQRTGAPLVLAILDLDNFKQINTRCGYEAGDRVLSAIGRALADAVRRDDLVARFGGDEFGLLLPGLMAEWAEEVVERIRSVVHHAEGETIITASAGYANMPRQTGNSPEQVAGELFAAADQALREAKAAGGDRTARR